MGSSTTTRSTCRSRPPSRTSPTRTCRRGTAASRRSRSTATARRPRRRCAPTRTRATRPFPARRRRGAVHGRARSTSSSRKPSEVAGGRAGRRQGPGQPGAQPDAARAPVDHAQVLDRRPRGLHHGRHVRGRHARRDLPHRHRQGGLDPPRPHELLRDRRSRSRSSMGCRWTRSSQVRLHALRAGGDHHNPEIPFAKSMPDYIMRWLASRFLDTDMQEEPAS